MIYMTKVRQEQESVFGAFDCPDADTRNRLIDLCAQNKLLVIACGEKSVRFRPPLILTKEEAGDGLSRIEAAIQGL